jgi:nicotinate-nucleotide adenylyltransferase
VSNDVIVFGGTFDPVHVGHLRIAEQVLRATGAAFVWFLPARIPALRDAPLAPAEDRLALLRTAVSGHPEFQVREDELRRSGPSYTVDTMHALRRDHPDLQVSLLLGADAARSIRRWQRADELQQREHFVIVNRSGVDTLGEDEATALGFAPERRRILAVDSPDVSASVVRRRAAAGESLNGLVPPEVARLIAERGLYAAQPRRMHNALG